MEDACKNLLVNTVFEVRGCDFLGRFPFHGQWIIYDYQTSDLFQKELSLNPHIIHSFLQHTFLYCLLLQKEIDHWFPLSKLYMNLIPKVCLDISEELCRRGLLFMGTIPLDVLIDLGQNSRRDSDSDGSSCGVGERGFLLLNAQDLSWCWELILNRGFGSVGKHFWSEYYQKNI